MIRLCKPLAPSPVRSTKRFVVGVNYAPRTPGAFLGCDFDVDEIQADFATMAELGIQDARILLPWSDFHSCPASGGCLATAHLIALCDAAAAEEVKLELAFFSGHLAPTGRTPRWLLPADEGASPYFCPSAKAIARQLVQGVSRVLALHPAVQGYNLGGLPARLASPDSLEAAREWFLELSADIRQQDPNRPIAWELEGADLCRSDGLRVDQLASPLDYSVVARPSLEWRTVREPHAEPALFACALATALTGKPSLLQEWSPPATLVGDARRMASHAETLLKGLLDQGALGAYLWWFAQPTWQSETPSGTAGGGLFDDSGQLRPHAAVLRDFAASQPKVIPMASANTRLTVDPDAFFTNPEEERQKLYDQFKQA